MTCLCLKKKEWVTQRRVCSVNIGGRLLRTERKNRLFVVNLPKHEAAENHNRNDSCDCLLICHRCGQKVWSRLGNHNWKVVVMKKQSGSGRKRLFCDTITISTFLRALAVLERFLLGGRKNRFRLLFFLSFLVMQLSVRKRLMSCRSVKSRPTCIFSHRWAQLFLTNL